MSKSTSLEKLNNALFQPLDDHEAVEIFGGMVPSGGGFTLIGRTGEADGSVVDDYVED